MNASLVVWGAVLGSAYYFIPRHRSFILGFAAAYAVSLAYAAYSSTNSATDTTGAVG